jgi:hypothetical protein
MIKILQISHNRNCQFSVGGQMTTKRKSIKYTRTENQNFHSKKSVMKICRIEISNLI